MELFNGIIETDIRIDFRSGGFTDTARIDCLELL